MDKTQSIGILDSGVGGVSVLRALLEVLPHENYLYFGDSANAPYGIKTEEEILRLSLAAVERLIKQEIKAIVIGCNTITSVAALPLRLKYPGMVIVATEPAVKPAVLSKPQGVVVVMATTATLQGKRFNALQQRYRDQAEIIKCPCPGLMDFVERGELDSPALRDYIQQRFAALGNVKPDAIVLGCTHYPFVRGVLQEIFGAAVPIFDGAPGIARQVSRRLAAENLLNDSLEQGKIIWQNSSRDPDVLELGKKLLTVK